MDYRNNPCQSVSSVVKNIYLYNSLAKLSIMELLYKELTGKIVDCAIIVHKSLGPGLLESAYEECLFYELQNCGLETLKQYPMPLIYKDKKLDVGYRIDLLVEDKIVIEVKSVDFLIPIHTAQLMTYMKLSECRIGLLINFNVQFLKEGIKRIII